MRFLVLVLWLLPLVGLAKSPPWFNPDRLIVLVKDSSDPKSVADSLSIKTENVFDKGSKGFTFIASEQSESFLSLSISPDVLVVERDQLVQVDFKPLLDNTLKKQVIPWGVKRTGYFDCSKDSACSKKRAFVIDTGIDLDHPDLNVDSSLGFNAIDEGNGNPGGNPDDDNSHGTHVAGIIGAIDNTFGVVGVAAGVKVVPIKVLDMWGLGSITSIIKGVQHVYDNANKGDVANLSLGGVTSNILDAVVKKLSTKILVTVAAGNNGRDAMNYSPSRVEASNVFIISAFDENDVYYTSSNYGSVVDKSEPGVRILSTIRYGKYTYYSGTSMAAPHAAGILLKEGKFDSSCQRVFNDPDDIADCIGLLPKNN